MNSCINIIDLNLDVLDIIFSELSMEDQINLGCAHPNLREAFLFHNRDKFDFIYLRRFPVEIWDSLLFLCGYVVKSLMFDSFNKDLLLAMNCAVKHCKSLEKITFTLQHVNNLDVVRRKLCELTSITDITIARASYKEERIALKRIIQSMQELPNLRNLSLRHFPEDALIQLRELTQLEVLRIDACKGSFTDIGYICATLKNLRVLHFQGILIDTDYLQDLPQFCPLLEELLLNSYNIVQIPYFPNLKELHVHIRNVPIHKSLGKCGHRYAKQLDELTIFADKRIKNSKLLEQLRGIKDFTIRVL